MSTPNDSNDVIEVTAATVDAAISQALEQLGAREDDVAITVLSTPRAGLLGLGARQARVRVTRRTPAAASSGVMSPPPAPPPRPRPQTPPRPPAAPVAPPAAKSASLPERPHERPMPAEEEERLEELADQAQENDRRPRTAIPPKAAPPARPVTPPRAPAESRQAPAPPVARPAARSAPLPERPHERPMPAEEEERLEELTDQMQENDRRPRGAIPPKAAPPARPVMPPRAPAESRQAPAAKSAPLPERPHERPMPAEEEERLEELTDQVQESDRRARGAIPPKTAPPARPVTSPRAPAESRQAPAAKSAPLPERPHERPMPAEEEERLEELTEQIQEDDRRIVETKGQVAEAAALLTRVLELMGEQATVETVCDDDPEMLEVNIKGDGSGLLIGRHGQTLDALEYIVNRVIARRIKDAAPISIDSEAYRARRRGQLHRMALGTGEEVKREHRAVTLEPMPPRDRRIIHLALKDDPLLTTRSAGEGFLRAIQIMPVDERREGGGGRGGREPRRGRGGPGEAPRADSPPVGEQGGFRHGQKRIV